MTTQTPNYNWSMPDPGGSPNTWGDTLNGTTGAIDTQMKQIEIAGVPIGVMTMWGGVTPPANWLICDGSAISRTTYSELFAILSTRFNTGATGDVFYLPDLRDTFPIGASATRALATKGGAATVTLDATMIPAHTHTASQPAHSHTATQPAHTHPDPGHTHGASETAVHSHGTNIMRFLGGSGQPLGISGGGNANVNYGNTDAASSAITVGSAVTGLQAAGNDAITVSSAQPAITVTNTGGGAAHNNMPPWVGINFIIKAK